MPSISSAKRPFIRWHYPSSIILFRTVSLLIAATFLFPYLTWAFEMETFQPHGYTPVFYQGQPIEIPKTAGQVTQTHQGHKGLIIQIQDLHCNEEVQTHIAQLIDRLAGRHHVRFVGIEGASLPINVTKLSLFPDKEIQKDVGRYFMQQGRLSGPEFYAATGRQKIFLEGIEKEENYRASRNCVATFLNEESLGLVDDLREAVNSIKPTIYHPALLEHDAQWQDYTLGRMPLLKFTAHLYKRAAAYRVNLLPFEKIRQFVSQGNRLPSSVNPQEVLDELELLEREVRSRIYQTDAERKLDEMFGRLQVMEKLLSISATPDELNDFRSRPEDYRVKPFLDYLRGHNIDSWLDLEIFALDGYLEQVNFFYRLADQRSRDFIANLTARIAKHGLDAGVLVTGGFHTEEILAQLRKQGWSYVSVRPTMKKINIINPYFSILRNRQTPLEKLLAQNQNILAPEPYLAPWPDAQVKIPESKLPTPYKVNYNKLGMTLILQWVKRQAAKGLLNPETLSMTKSESQNFVLTDIKRFRRMILVTLGKTFAIIRAPGKNRLPGTPLEEMHFPDRTFTFYATQDLDTIQMALQSHSRLDDWLDKLQAIPGYVRNKLTAAWIGLRARSAWVYTTMIQYFTRLTIKSPSRHVLQIRIQRNLGAALLTALFLPFSNSLAMTMIAVMKSARKNLYFFQQGHAEGSATMALELGVKGAQLSGMVHLGLPVPLGFIIHSAASIEHNRQQNLHLSQDLKSEIKQNRKKSIEISDLAVLSNSEIYKILIQVESQGLANIFTEIARNLDQVRQFMLSDAEDEAKAAENEEKAEKILRQANQAIMDGQILVLNRTATDWFHLLSQVIEDWKINHPDKYQSFGELIDEITDQHGAWYQIWLNNFRFRDSRSPINPNKINMINNNSGAIQSDLLFFLAKKIFNLGSSLFYQIKHFFRSATRQVIFPDQAMAQLFLIISVPLLISPLIIGLGGVLSFPVWGTALMGGLLLLYGFYHLIWPSEQIITLDGMDNPHKRQTALEIAHQLGFELFDITLYTRALYFHSQQLNPDQNANQRLLQLDQEKIKFQLKTINDQPEIQVLYDDNDITKILAKEELIHEATVFSRQGPIKTLIEKKVRQAARHRKIIVIGQNARDILADHAILRTYVVTSDRRQRAEHIFKKSIKSSELLSATLSKMIIDDHSGELPYPYNEMPLIVDCEIIDSSRMNPQLSATHIVHILKQKRSFKTRLNKALARLNPKPRLLGRGEGETQYAHWLRKHGDAWVIFMDSDGLSSFNRIDGKAAVNLLIADFGQLALNIAQSKAARQILGPATIRDMLTIRYGGDEFVFVLNPSLKETQIQRFMDLVRQRIAIALHKKYMIAQVMIEQHASVSSSKIIAELDRLCRDLCYEHDDPQLVRLTVDDFWGPRLLFRANHPVFNNKIIHIFQKKIELKKIPAHFELIKFSAYFNSPEQTHPLLDEHDFLNKGFIFTPTMSLGAAKTSEALSKMTDTSFAVLRRKELISASFLAKWIEETNKLAAKALHAAKNETPGKYGAKIYQRATEETVTVQSDQPRTEHPKLFSASLLRLMHFENQFNHENRFIRLWQRLPLYDALVPWQFSHAGLRATLGQFQTSNSIRDQSSSRLFIARAPPQMGPDKIHLIYINYDKVFGIELEPAYYGPFTKLAVKILKSKNPDKSVFDQELTNYQVGSRTGEPLYRFSFINNTLGYVAGDEVISVPHLFLIHPEKIYQRLMAASGTPEKAVTHILDDLEQSLNLDQNNLVKYQYHAAYAEITMQEFIDQGPGELFRRLQIASLSRQPDQKIHVYTERKNLMAHVLAFMNRLAKESAVKLLTLQGPALARVEEDALQAKITDFQEWIGTLSILKSPLLVPVLGMAVFVLFEGTRRWIPILFPNFSMQRFILFFTYGCPIAIGLYVIPTILKLGLIQRLRLTLRQRLNDYAHWSSRSYLLAVTTLLLAIFYPSDLSALTILFAGTWETAFFDPLHWLYGTGLVWMMSYLNEKFIHPKPQTIRRAGPADLNPRLKRKSKRVATMIPRHSLLTLGFWLIKLFQKKAGQIRQQVAAVSMPGSRLVVLAVLSAISIPLGAGTALGAGLTHSLDTLRLVTNHTNLFLIFGSVLGILLLTILPNQGKIAKREITRFLFESGWNRELIKKIFLQNKDIRLIAQLLNAWYVLDQEYSVPRKNLLNIKKITQSLLLVDILGLKKFERNISQILADHPDQIVVVVDFAPQGIPDADRQRVIILDHHKIGTPYGITAFSETIRLYPAIRFRLQKSLDTGQGYIMVYNHVDADSMLPMAFLMGLIPLDTYDQLLKACHYCDHLDGGNLMAKQIHRTTLSLAADFWTTQQANYKNPSIRVKTLLLTLVRMINQPSKFSQYYQTKAKLIEHHLNILKSLPLEHRSWDTLDHTDLADDRLLLVDGEVLYFPEKADGELEPLNLEAIRQFVEEEMPHLKVMVMLRPFPLKGKNNPGKMLLISTSGDTYFKHPNVYKQFYEPEKTSIAYLERPNFISGILKPGTRTLNLLRNIHATLETNYASTDIATTSKHLVAASYHEITQAELSDAVSTTIAFQIIQRKISFRQFVDKVRFDFHSRRGPPANPNESLETFSFPSVLVNLSQEPHVRSELADDVVIALFKQWQKEPANRSRATYFLDYGLESDSRSLIEMARSLMSVFKSPPFILGAGELRPELSVMDISGFRAFYDQHGAIRYVTHTTNPGTSTDFQTHWPERASRLNARRDAFLSSHDHDKNLTHQQLSEGIVADPWALPDIHKLGIQLIEAIPEHLKTKIKKTVQVIRVTNPQRHYALERWSAIRDHFNQLLDDSGYLLETTYDLADSSLGLFSIFKKMNNRLVRIGWRAAHRMLPTDKFTFVDVKFFEALLERQQLFTHGLRELLDYYMEHAQPLTEIAILDFARHNDLRLWDLQHPLTIGIQTNKMPEAEQLLHWEREYGIRVVANSLIHYPTRIILDHPEELLLSGSSLIGPILEAFRERLCFLNEPRSILLLDAPFPTPVSGKSDWGAIQNRLRSFRKWLYHSATLAIQIPRTILHEWGSFSAQQRPAAHGVIVTTDGRLEELQANQPFYRNHSLIADASYRLFEALLLAGKTSINPTDHLASSIGGVATLWVWSAGLLRSLIGWIAIGGRALKPSEITQEGTKRLYDLMRLTALPDSKTAATYTARFGKTYAISSIDVLPLSQSNLQFNHFKNILNLITHYAENGPNNRPAIYVADRILRLFYRPIPKKNIFWKPSRGWWLGNQLLLFAILHYHALHYYQDQQIHPLKSIALALGWMQKSPLESRASVTYLPERLRAEDIYNRGGRIAIGLRDLLKLFSEYRREAGIQEPTGMTILRQRLQTLPEADSPFETLLSMGWQEEGASWWEECIREAASLPTNQRSQALRDMAAWLIDQTQAPQISSIRNLSPRKNSLVYLLNLPKTYRRISSELSFLKKSDLSNDLQKRLMNLQQILDAVRTNAAGILVPIPEEAGLVLLDEISHLAQQDRGASCFLGNDALEGNHRVGLTTGEVEVSSNEVNDPVDGLVWVSRPTRIVYEVTHPEGTKFNSALAQFKKFLPVGMGVQEYSGTIHLPRLADLARSARWIRWVEPLGRLLPKRARHWFSRRLQQIDPEGYLRIVLSSRTESSLTATLADPLSLMHQYYLEWAAQPSRQAEKKFINAMVTFLKSTMDQTDQLTSVKSFLDITERMTSLRKKTIGYLRDSDQIRSTLKAPEVLYQSDNLAAGQTLQKILLRSTLPVFITDDVFEIQRRKLFRKISQSA